MELPIELKQILEEYARDIPLKKLTAAASEMSQKYRAENGFSVKMREQTFAYAVVRMPATYCAAFFALEQAAARFGTEIETMLDVGAGTGAVCWAAGEIFPVLNSVTCLEREKNMSEIGEMLMKEGSFPCDFTWNSFDITSGAALPKSQLVTASYVLNELNASERKSVISRLWNATEKLLVVIEPGTPAGFAVLREVREKLIQLGAYIAAPCPLNGECPIGTDDWCHFSVRVARSKLHKQLKGGDAPYEDEKFCYIAAARERTEQCSARVIRHPKIESGKITLPLCTAEGISQKIVTKKDGMLFKKARKTDWGEEL